MQYLITYKRPRRRLMEPGQTPVDPDEPLGPVSPVLLEFGGTVYEAEALPPETNLDELFWRELDRATESSLSTYAAGPFDDPCELDAALRQLRQEGAIELRTWQIQADDFSPDDRRPPPEPEDRIRFDRDDSFGVPGVRVRFPYNAEVVARMKAEIPRGHREYCGDDKSWWVSARFAPELRMILADEWGPDIEAENVSPEVSRALRLLASFGVDAVGSERVLILCPDAVDALNDLIRRGNRTTW